MNLISKDYLKKHLPPNMDVETAHVFVRGVLAIGSILAFTIFLCTYGGLYNRLFAFIYGKKELLEGMMMASFPKVIKGMCIVHLCSIFCFLAYSLQLYSSFFGKSQSIYLMKRLPNGKKTLRHMVMDVPLRCALIYLALAAVLVLAAFLIWRFITPAVCLPM